MDKKKSGLSCHVKWSFWSMIALFVLMMVFSVLRWQIPSLVAGILFIISVFYVFVSSIMSIFPENSMAYIALGVASIFVLYLLLSATIGLSASVLG
jgi:hypothetical protein